MGSGRRFASKQCTLAVYAPAIAGERAVAAYHPVTRNRDSHCIRGTCLRDRTYRLRRTEAHGDLLVAYGYPRRNSPQRLPDAPLEFRAPYIERQREIEFRCFDQLSHSCSPILELRICRQQLRPREAPLQIALKSFRVVAE